MFYAKLAAKNMQKNFRIYLPFFLSMIFLVAINTLTQIIINNDGMTELPDSASAISMFNLGSVIIMIFSVIFSIYTNSFLLKQRKKELGLYNVLGLGKRELRIMMFWESLWNFFIVVPFGLLTGTVFSKLAFLVLKKMLGVGDQFVYQFKLTDILTVLVLFAGIFLILLLLNILQIQRTNPIELLHGGQIGEKEPKSNWLFALLGIIALGCGYYLSLTIKSPIAAITTFFIATLWVILGTYLLFISSSIVILRLLRKNKKFYYQPNHFISIASMLYRMKQNAAGLASICILSTMVLVTLSTTVSLFYGQKDLVKTRNPYDVMLKTTKPAEMTQIITENAKKHQITLTEENSLLTSDNFLFTRNHNHFKAVSMTDTAAQQAMMDDAVLIQLMPLSEYQRLSGDTATLADGETIFLPVQGKFPQKTLRLADQTFTIKKQLKTLKGMPKADGLMDTGLLILPDSTIQPVIASWYDLNKYPELGQMNTLLEYNTKGTKKNQLAFAKETEIAARNIQPNVSFSAKAAFEESIRTFTAGFLFLGGIFGLTFILATALIIYYKQVSEGLQDKLRFTILQKVGMSHNEVKKTIQSQILMVFCFPLLLAVLHLTVAFPIIKKLILLFGMTNDHLFLVVTAITILIFALLYFSVYQLTAKTYYRLVER